MIRLINCPEWLQAYEQELTTWIESCVGIYGYRLDELSYTFCEDNEIRELNQQHLQHDYPTDIITFDYSSPGVLKAEIYIGIEVVEQNANRFEVSLQEEVCRVIIHGVLHAMGYNDQTTEESQEMRQNEDKCLVLRPKNLIIN